MEWPFFFLRGWGGDYCNTAPVSGIIVCHAIKDFIHTTQIVTTLLLGRATKSKKKYN